MFTFQRCLSCHPWNSCHVCTFYKANIPSPYDSFYSLLFSIVTFHNQHTTHPKNDNTINVTHFQIRISSLPFSTRLVSITYINPFKTSFISLHAQNSPKLSYLLLCSCVLQALISPTTMVSSSSLSKIDQTTQTTQNARKIVVKKSHQRDHRLHNRLNHSSETWHNFSQWIPWISMNP